MKEATLITPKFEKIVIHSRDEFYQMAYYSHGLNNSLPIWHSPDIAFSMDSSFDIVNIPVRRFCVDETPQSDLGYLPPELREVREWYIAMDPLIQECFNNELSDWRNKVVNANHGKSLAEQKAEWYKMKLEAIENKTAWQTFKTAWSKMWGRP